MAVSLLGAQHTQPNQCCFKTTLDDPLVFVGIVSGHYAARGHYPLIRYDGGGGGSSTIWTSPTGILSPPYVLVFLGTDGAASRRRGWHPPPPRGILAPRNQLLHVAA